MNMFTCGVASLANIGGSASAPILAGAYSGALVPVGVLMALSVADRAYVLETGRVVMEGTGAELLTNERVRSAYLGG